MKKTKILLAALVLSLSMVIPTTVPLIENTVAIAEAATPKLSKTKLSLTVGKSTTLQMKNTKKTVTWKTSKKSVATVTNKGKITAKAVGTATITATVSGKKYTCKVTVKKAANPSLKDAPFTAVEFNLEKLNMVVPKNWKPSITSNDDGSHDILINPDDDESAINILVMQNEDNLPLNDIMEELGIYVEESAILDLMTANIGVPIELKDYKSKNNNTKVVDVIKVSYTVYIAELELSLPQSIYLLTAGDYFVYVDVTDGSDKNIDADVEYMINSIRINK